MKDGPDFVRIAALMGDPARANMLAALMTGRALTASELAREAGITVQTASSHIAKLAEGGLVLPRKQGRHRYVTLASEGVAEVLEALMGVAAQTGHLRTRTGPNDDAMRKARVCYNHLAGALATELYDALLKDGAITMTASGIGLSASGEQVMDDFGIDVASLRARRAPLCRECLDWSERKTHLAGSLGRAILSRIEGAGWAARDPNSRAVRFTASGESRFRAAFGLGGQSASDNVMK